VSKLDAQRALKLAKYERDQERAAARNTASPRVNATPAPVAPPVSKAAPRKAAPAGDTCGHKSMNGRACTREAGHSEKSHRYS
jgi:hypothetical protein